MERVGAEKVKVREVIEKKEGKDGENDYGHRIFMRWIGVVSN